MMSNLKMRLIELQEELECCAVELFLLTGEPEHKLIKDISKTAESIIEFTDSVYG